MRRLDFDSLTLLFMDLLLREISVQEFFEEVYSRVRLPMNYFDTSFNLVANAFERPFYFKLWRIMDENGTFMDEEISAGNFLEYQEKMYRIKHSSIFDYGTVEGYPQACGPVILDGKLIGYMGTMVEDVERGDALLFNDMMTEAIIVITRKQLKDNASSSMGLSEELLLSDSIPPASRELLSRTYPGPYAYIIISCESESASTLLYVQKFLSENISNTFSCHEGECYLHTLISGYSEKDSLPVLRSTLERYGLTAGVSDWFDDLSNLKTRRMQAYLALAVGYNYNQSERLFLFRDYIFNVAALCIFERGLAPYILPEIKELSRIDRDTGSAYIETLSCYTSCRSNSTECAKRLGIHPNTVLSRLKKIEELTGLSMHNTRKLETVAFQLDLLRYVAEYGEILTEEEKWIN